MGLIYQARTYAIAKIIMKNELGIVNQQGT
jgi:hypothetical protein